MKIMSSPLGHLGYTTLSMLSIYLEPAPTLLRLCKV